MNKYLGVDWGDKRIGLALAEEGFNVAWPLKVVNTLSEVLEVISEEEIDVLIIGHPLKMKDSQQQVDSRFTKFVESLKKQVNIPVKLVDERLSSLEADNLIGDKKDKAPRDAISAKNILETYLTQKRT